MAVYLPVFDVTNCSRGEVAVSESRLSVLSDSLPVNEAIFSRFLMERSKRRKNLAKDYNVTTEQEQEQEQEMHAEQKTRK